MLAEQRGIVQDGLPGDLARADEARVLSLRVALTTVCLLAVVAVVLARAAAPRQ